MLGLLVLGALWAWPAAAGATLPGTNGLIVYQGFDAAAFDIDAITPNGVVRQQLSQTGSSPSWSASGSRIAFSDQTPTSQVEIFTMERDGSGRQQLTSLGSAGFPAWSPDDSKIAFASYSTTTFNYDIWVMDADGANPTQLTNAPSEDIRPAWSPDGTKLAFQTDRDGDREIYVMDADAGHLRNLTDRHDTEEEAPDWSPDGSRMLFTSAEAGGVAVYVTDADGTGATRLAGGSEAVWSPDGRRIAFVRNVDGGGLDLFTLSPDGTGETRLTNDGGQRGFLDWQPLNASSLTSTSVAAPRESIVFGESVPFTATVSSDGSTPTGTVQFRIGDENEGDPVRLDAGGHAAFDPPFLVDVGDSVSATYGGDARWGWSSGDAALNVAPALTTTTLSVSPNPVPTHGTVDVNVTVTNTSTPIAPFGSIKLSVDGVPVGLPLGLDDDGRMDIALDADIAAGDHRVIADYSDDTADIADFVPSSDSVVERVTGPGAAPTPQPPATPQPQPQPQVPGPAISPKTLTRFTSLLTQSLRKHGYAALSGKGARFAALVPGTLSQTIYVRTRSGRPTARGTVLAAGRHEFATPGSSRLRLRLTHIGKRLVRHAKLLRVQINTRWKSATGRAIAVTQRLTVRRHVQAHAGAGRPRVHPAGRTVLRMAR